MSSAVLPWQSNPVSGTGSIHEAADLGDIRKLEEFIQRGLDNGYPDRVSLQVRDELLGAMPLHFAAERGHLNVVEFLVQHQVDIDAGDNNRVTALHLASITNSVRVVDFLIQNGAKVALPDCTGDTPLHWAATRGHPQTAEILVQHKAPVDPSNHQGWTPLHRAAFNGRTSTCEFLLKRGASLQAVNVDGNTALHVACASNRMTTAEYLLTWDTPLDIRNAEGRTPADMVSEKFAEAMAEIVATHQREKKRPRAYLAKQAIKRMQTRTSVAPSRPDSGVGRASPGARAGVRMPSSPEARRPSLPHRALRERDALGFPLVAEETPSLPPPTPEFGELELVSYIEASRRTPLSPRSGSSGSGPAQGLVGTDRQEDVDLLSSSSVVKTTTGAGGVGGRLGGELKAVDDDLMSPWDSDDDDKERGDGRDDVGHAKSGVVRGDDLLGGVKRRSSFNVKFLEKYNLQKHTLFAP
ncbi:unnamed protein product [Ostreobium quekettii]|uniref:Uncharacterized protein n=1 Tax=Ostreobium quekettii TaxID=121088 RepID=A0A8S1IUJ0_9CHLO|nr:unnamed protein product [Ostreobium quekettii]